MISISSELLQTWIIALLWPLTRVLGFIAVAPIFSHKAVPNQVKLGFAMMLTLMVMPILLSLPQFEIFSWYGLLLLVEQLVIGLAIGFSMRVVLAAIDIAGQIIGMTMGLGFASFFDPNTHGQSTALTQFLILITMLVFLSLDGHLLMVSAVADSFTTMPIALNGAGIQPMKIVNWAEAIFSTGLLLSLPAITALLMTNMALGILTRTAPQLNLFGIGFPITLSMGLLIILLTLPGMLKPIENLIEQGISHMSEIATKPSAIDPILKP